MRQSGNDIWLPLEMKKVCGVAATIRPTLSKSTQGVLLSAISLVLSKHGIHYIVYTQTFRFIT
jgi:hypothetical protein